MRLTPRGPVAAWLPAFTGFLLSLASILFFVANKNLVPHWDMIPVLHFLNGGGSHAPVDGFSSSFFFFRDNEHRPALPMLVWLLDRALFESAGYLPQALMFVCIFPVAWLCTSWSAPAGRPLRWMTAFGASALLLSPLHWENLVWEKQIHVYLALLFSLLSFYWFSGGTSTPRGILTGVSAFLATFSFGYGVVTWPVLLLHGFLQRAPWRLLLAVFVPGVLALCLYAVSYEVLPYHSDPAESLRSPLALGRYTLLFLGGVLVASGLPAWLGAIAALCSLLLLVPVAWRLYWRRHPAAPSQTFSFLVCALCLGIGLLTALGRVTVNYGVDSRYLVVSALYFVALPGAAAIRFPRTGESRAFLRGFAMACLLLNLAGYARIDALRERQFFIREGVAAAVLATEPLNIGIFPDHRLANDVVLPGFFEQHLDSPALYPVQWLGHQLPEALVRPRRAAACVGYLDILERKTGKSDEMMVVGWARMGADADRQPAWILVTDEQHRMIGLAAPGLRRDDVLTALGGSWLDELLTQDNRAGFQGHVRAQGGQQLEFFAYRDSRACHFASARVPPA